MTLVLLVVLAATLFAAWFFTAHEKYTQIEYTGYRGEARVNDFLAAELLLDELGIEAESRTSLVPDDWLPGSSDTIISRLTSTMALGDASDLLHEWVTNGGHLVLLPPSEESRIADEFLQDLGFRLTTAHGEETEEDDSDDGEQEKDEDSYTYLVDLENTWYRIEMVDGVTPTATLTDELGIVAARREWSGGYITVIANADYFGNAGLDISDHARLLLDTVAGYIDPGKVWLIYDAAFPSLAQVIWQSAPYAVIGLLILVVTWLWSIMPRFGPAIRSEPVVRRSIIEHIRAAGNFAWKNEGVSSLANSSTAAIMHEAAIRHPGLDRLETQDQARQIARLTGLPLQEVFNALSGQDISRQREFTHNMQALQRIRKKL